MDLCGALFWVGGDEWGWVGVGGGGGGGGGGGVGVLLDNVLLYSIYFQSI